MNIQLFLNDSAESKIAQLEQLLAEDARKGKVYKWIKVNNNPVPLDKDGNPLSSVGKKIFSGSENKNGKSSRASRKSSKSGESVEEVCLRYYKIPEGAVTGNEAHSVTSKVSSVRPRSSSLARSVLKYTRDGELGENSVINKALRNRDNKGKKPREILDNYHCDIVKDIDHVFEIIPKTRKPLRVFRGIDHDETIDDIDQYGFYQDKGFVSTSTTPSKALKYSGGKVILIIDIPAGYNALSIGTESMNPKDAEILLPRGQKLMVKSTKKVGNLTYHHVIPE